MMYHLSKTYCNPVILMYCEATKFYWIGERRRVNGINVKDYRPTTVRKAFCWSNCSAFKCINPARYLQCHLVILVGAVATIQCTPALHTACSLRWKMPLHSWLSAVSDISSLRNRVADSHRGFTQIFVPGKADLALTSVLIITHLFI